jgi:hypothetical protein
MITDLSKSFKNHKTLFTSIGDGAILADEGGKGHREIFFAPSSFQDRMIFVYSHPDGAQDPSKEVTSVTELAQALSTAADSGADIVREMEDEEDDDDGQWLIGRANITRSRSAGSCVQADYGRQDSFGTI